MITLLSRRALLALAIPLLLAACGGGGGGGGSDASVTPPTTPPATPPAVTLNAATSASQLLAGGTATLTATASDNSAVTWQLDAGAPGTLSATTGASITYTAPATVAVPTPVTITATAGSASKALQLVVNPAPGAAGLSLIAGSLGSHTVVDGTGTAARFKSIQQLAAAPDGSFLVADQGLRRVSATGVVTTIASFSGIGYGLAATADGGAWLIKSNDGVASLYRAAADGTLTAIGSPSPLLDITTRLVAGGSGDLYGISACRIIRASASGVLSTLAGSTCTSSQGNDGQGSAAGFSGPSDLARLANGDLYVADGQRVRRVTAGGAVTTLALMDAATGSGLPVEAWIQSIAARPDGTLAVLVKDNTEQVVYRLQLDGTLTALVRRALVRHVNQNDFTTHLTDFTTLRADTAGRLLLASVGDLQLVQGSTLVPFAGLEDDSLADVNGAGAAARFVAPTYVAADLRGNTYVTDNAMQGIAPFGGLEGSGLTVRKIDAAGNVTTILSNDTFGRPRGLLADQSGNLYVTEQAPMGNRINQLGGAVYRIAPNGALTRIAGGYDATIDIVDGKGDAARFVQPTFAGIAADGTLYVNDHRVNDTTVVLRKVAPDGTVTTVQSLPDDVGRAPDGQRYGYDSDTVYRINADGTRTVVAGQTGKQGTVLGALPGAVTPPATYWPLLPGGQLTPTGLHTFALISNAAIVKLVLPH